MRANEGRHFRVTGVNTGSNCGREIGESFNLILGGRGGVRLLRVLTNSPLFMKRFSLLLFSVGFLFAGGVFSHALTIPASEDTTGGTQITPDSNVAPLLSVNANSKAYLYFSLNGIPTTAVVRWAKLRLFLPTVEKKGMGLSVYRVSGFWDESRGSASPVLEDGAVATISGEELGSKRFVTADVTGVVQQWISGGSENEGFAIGVTEGSVPASVKLTSKEGAGMGLPAELDIDFAADGVPASSVAMEQLNPALREFVASLSKPVVKVPPAISSNGMVRATVESPLRMSFQWYKNGVPVEGGTSASLALEGLGSGTYTLKSENEFASTTSGPVVFNLNTYLPRILKQPSILEDGSLSVSGTVGAGTFSVQWYRDGGDLARGIGTNMQIPFSAGLSTGTYTVKLSNGFGAVLSAPVVFDSKKVASSFGMKEVLGGTLTSASGLQGKVVGTFQLGKYEVTWGEWKLVREWGVRNGYTDLADVGAGVGDNYPVTNVNWYDAVKWCNAKSAKDGLVPVYQVSGATYKTGQSTPTLKASARGYRLPTEAEWEWAARGGVLTHGYTYSGSNNINSVGWTYDISSDGIKAVGSKAANELGLFDMTGNVSEWCWDLGASDSTYRRIRGGGWMSFASASTVAYRDENHQNFGTAVIGFRIACSSVK